MFASEPQVTYPTGQGQITVVVALALIGTIIPLARWSSRNRAWRLASIPALIGLVLTAAQQLPGASFLGYTVAFVTPIVASSVRNDDVHEPVSRLNMFVIAVVVITSCWIAVLVL